MTCAVVRAASWADRARRGVVAAGFLTALLAPVGPPAYADEISCDVTAAAEPGEDQDPGSRAASSVLQRLRISEAHELATGRGITVAVVDDGISTRPVGGAPSPLAGTDAIPIQPADGRTLKGEVIGNHGTIVAGLIAGGDVRWRKDRDPLGIAPDASLVSVRVADVENASDPDEAVELTVDSVIRGLRWVADNAEARSIGVVNVSLRVEPTPAQGAALERAVRDLLAEDVVIVAAAGNRATDEDGSTAPDPDGDEDVLPADYPFPGVISVGLQVPAGVDQETVAAPNRSIDVVAPVDGAISVLANGSTCTIGASEAATSWSTAEVAGVAALLRERYPRDNAAQIEARIKATATGSLRSHSRWTGYGTVQPLEALTRTLAPAADGELPTLAAGPANTDPIRVDPAPDDPYVPVRRAFVWWGVFAGSALVIALLLRPLVRRTR